MAKNPYISFYKGRIFNLVIVYLVSVVYKLFILVERFTARITIISLLPPMKINTDVSTHKHILVCCLCLRRC